MSRPNSQRPTAPRRIPMGRTRGALVASSVLAGAMAMALVGADPAAASEDPSTYVITKGASAELNDVHFDPSGHKASYTEIACDDARDGYGAIETMLITTANGEYSMPAHKDTRGSGTCDGLDRSAVDSGTVIKIRIKICRLHGNVRSNCAKSPFVVNPIGSTPTPTVR